MARASTAAIARQHARHVFVDASGCARRGVDLLASCRLCHSSFQGLLRSSVAIADRIVHAAQVRPPIPLASSAQPPAFPALFSHSNSLF